MADMPRVAAGIHVYFLGTGSPSPSGTRHGIATLLQAGPHWLLFDTGRATLQRMYDCGIPVADVTNVFYTHLHSDHVCGFADFWMTGWFICGRQRPLALFGPPGTRRFAAGIEEAHHFDLAVRPAYEDAVAAGLTLDVSEFGEGVVFERDGVQVSAFAVDHGPHVKPAFGFRVEYAGYSVVLSGDTTACESLVRHAAGADLLINELAGASEAELARKPHLGSIIAIHTNPEQLADICIAARPRATLINHVSLWDMSTADVIERIAVRYDGVVDVAEDRMEVIVGADIRMIPPGVPDAGAARVPLTVEP